jgi:hypothetical protein
MRHPRLAFQVRVPGYTCHDYSRQLTVAASISMIQHPITVYINWAAYDELSDNVELTEALAMRQLDELLRLRKSGVRFDYYLMDAFWYARDGGYRTWRKPHWPNGPDAWLEKCLANDVKPGLWVAGNSTHSHDPVAAWRDSLAADHNALCMFSGGFLNHFLESLHIWYERGVRMFKFDFMNFNAVTPALERTMLPSEIRAQNGAALLSGLKAFCQSHPEVVLLAYNGFEELPTQNITNAPYRKTVDTKWLEVFDSLYCGDPRPADVPTMNFWRSKDIYSDHMVRIYELNGFPLSRIDNSAFMVGTTGTCYYRKTAAWKGMLLLSLARGGWVNTYYGNLDLLGTEQAIWFAKLQSLYLGLQAHAHFFTFGELPGNVAPYGFAVEDGFGALYAVVNPTQMVASVALPSLAGMEGSRVLFSDVGYTPQLSAGYVTLGPEQVALVGVGKYASVYYGLGVQEDVSIPSSIEPLVPAHIQREEKVLMALVKAPSEGSLRIVFTQQDAFGVSRRTTGGAPPAGVSLGKMLSLSAWQNEHPVDVAINYDKAVWSGLSWAVGEVTLAGLVPGGDIVVRCSTVEQLPVELKVAFYHVTYEGEVE